MGSGTIHGLVILRSKILYRWSVVKCLPTKPEVASVGREAVGVVRASVR